MLSDSDERAKRRSVRNRAVDGKGRHWSDAQKIEAVKTFLMTGSPSLTCSILKIPENTLKTWRNCEWWKDLQAEFKTQDDLQLSAKLQKIIARSLDSVEDRLENGEYYFDTYTGDLRRKPVTALTAHKIASDMMVRRDAVLERHFSEKTVTEDKVQKTLENLAKSFAELAAGTKKTIEVTDVIFEKENQYDLSGNSFHGDAGSGSEESELSDLPKEFSSEERNS